METYFKECDYVKLNLKKNAEFNIQMLNSYLKFVP